MRHFALANYRRVFFGALIILGILLGSSLARVHGQEVMGLDVAKTIRVTDSGAVEGDIVSYGSNTEQLSLTKVAGDAKMFGVLVLDPLVVYKTIEEIPVVRTGDVMVNVTTIQGVIAPGDLLTSSTIPGKAEKAGDTKGYMLGTALTSFGNSDGESFQYQGKTYRRGKVRTEINIRPISFTGGNIFATLQQTQSAGLEIIRDQNVRDRYFRYLIALIIVIATVYFGYRTFGRNVQKGIEGIGRNPLAKVSIQSMIILNMALIGIVSIGGMVLALLIISL